MEKGKSSTRAKNKYNSTAYDNIRLIVKKGDKEKIKAAAELNEKSLNLFITDLIYKELKNYSENLINNHINKIRGKENEK